MAPDDNPIDEMTPYATVGAVKDGSVTVTLGGMDFVDGRLPIPLERPTPDQCHASADVDSRSARR